MNEEFQTKNAQAQPPTYTLAKVENDTENVNKPSIEASGDSPAIHEKDASSRHSVESSSVNEMGSNTSTKPEPLQTTTTQKSEPMKDYSIFTKSQKQFIVFAATMGSFFSPFTAQIYFPALTTIASDLGVTNDRINLTVTTYMIFQAVSPAFIGQFSDTAGRRPAYIICFVIYIVADIALALQRNYVALLVLRMVQSAGSSGTVALANAIVSDVATSAERGSYMAITSLAVVLAPSLGPVLGGVISQYAGWHWIFWFLAILAMVFFVPTLLFMPETCRAIVDDGSVPPPKWNRSLLNHINEKKRQRQGLGTPDYALRDELAKKRGPVRFPNPLAALVILFEIEGFFILFYASVLYAGWYAILSGMPTQFKEIYGYNDLIIGLMYLPMSGGAIVAAFTQGRIIDWSFARQAKRVGMTVKRSKDQDLSNFPIERARLSAALPMVLLAAITTIIYGWILHFRTSIAGPCIILFVNGFACIAATQCVSILIVDINKGQAGTATAAFNLIRCLLGAGATALILPMTNAMGYGWSYTLIGLIYVVCSPMLLIVMKYGPGWRRARKEKAEANAKVKKEREEEKMREGGGVV